jgi:hypothetical protein
MVPGGTVIVVEPPRSYSHETVPPSAGVCVSHIGFASAVPAVVATASAPMASDVMHETEVRGKGWP